MSSPESARRDFGQFPVFPAAEPDLVLVRKDQWDATRGDNCLLKDEVERLRQGLWDIYRVLGGDTDGDETPRSLVSDIVTAVQIVATEVREELDRCWEENCGCI